MSRYFTQSIYSTYIHISLYIVCTILNCIYGNRNCPFLHIIPLAVVKTIHRTDNQIFKETLPIDNDILVQFSL